MVAPDGSSRHEADAQEVRAEYLKVGHSGRSLVGVYQTAIHRLAAVAPQLALNYCLLIWGRRTTELLSPQGERRGILMEWSQILPALPRAPI